MAIGLVARSSAWGKSCVLLGWLFGRAAIAVGQWTAINLHPEGASASEAQGSDGSRQIGTVTAGGVQSAGNWQGTASSWNSLASAGPGSSAGYGGRAGQQVGASLIGSFYGASLWSGTSGSYVDLTPEGATAYTAAYATDGVRQVGATTVAGMHRASLWSGTAESWVDLSGGLYSDAFGIDGDEQVGSRNINFRPHAGLWRGTAESWVDLHPGGIYFRSAARAVHGGRQAGFAVATNNASHAALWSGTAASFVSLMPAGASHSEAYGIAGDYQVGNAVFSAVRKAGVWQGTAASWTDLHALLPAGFSSSQAQGVSIEGGIVRVVGYGFNDLASRQEALMWVSSPVPEPGTLLVLSVGLLPLACRRERYLRGFRRPRPLMDRGSKPL